MSDQSSENDGLPEGWAAGVLNEVGQWGTGGTPSRKVDSYFGGAIAWVKSGDLNDGYIHTTEQTLTAAGIANSFAKVLPKGSVIVALYGATIGKLGILAIDAATNQACATCQVNSQLADRRFIFYFIRQQRQSLIDAGQGGAQPNLTNGIVRNWPVSLPPLAEQRIVRRVDALFALADKIESRAKSATARVEKITQAILAKAFRGELVPTEAELARQEGRDYEPASALLERVRADRKSPPRNATRHSDRKGRFVHGSLRDNPEG
jgi:type I restriction enzyme, S subunit